MTNSSAITVLQTSELPAPAEHFLKNHFRLLRVPEDETARQDFLSRHGAEIRAIAGSGKGKVDAAMLAALPNLEMISVQSAGLDGIDTEATAARAIPISNTSTVLADDVADLALWLVLGTTRKLVEADAFIRRGEWTYANMYPLGKTISTLKIGIIGLGHIGKAIARRLEMLGAEVAYTGRSQQTAEQRRYFPDTEALAAWSDVLVVSCPATAETHHLVNEAVLAALGPEGILVNIARGSIVDEAALTKAIESGTIAGAGLDVFEFEPQISQALVESKRTILLPHIGSATEGTRNRMWQHMIEVLLAHFDMPPADWSTLGK